MKNDGLNGADINSALEIIRGREAGVPLNVAIVGGGKACRNLLEILDSYRLARMNMKILGVSDENQQAPGIVYAREIGLYTTSDFRDLFSLKNINMLIEITGSEKIRDQLYNSRSPGVAILDHVAAPVIWELLQTEVEKTELEKERKSYELNSKKKMQMILDSLPYRIMVVNLDKTVDMVNKTFLNEFKLGDKVITGNHCYQLRYHLEKSCKEEGRICHLEDSISDLEHKGSISTLREFKDEYGETRFEVITIAPIFNDNGRLIQILEVSRDVTERAKLEREVEKSNKFFENVIQSTVDGIVVVDTKGNVLIFNEGMERLTGHSAEDIIKRGHLSTFYDMDVAKENMQKMRSSEYGPVGRLNPTAMSVKTKNGEEIPVTLSASIITIDGKEIGSVGVFTDMREIFKMRRDLEDAHLQLVQSEKIASVGRMAAGVAHEINNPLSGALIYAELLKEDLKNQPERISDVQEIIDQTLRCKKIVAELLEFSRQSVGRTSSFSLEYLINKCLSLLINQAIFQDITVEKDIEASMPEMLGDMGQLQQVFTNLFINAAHAMESKGTLGIKVKCNRDNSVFVIKVSDTGPGIPVELRDKIFEIFFTTKPVGSGTGLGLSISQNIIKLHGGKISFDCPPGGGTVFTIELPFEFKEQEFSTDEPVFIGLD
ncbi:ATPase/histidine kinase/DNA gyrase B/HSP90 domain protein (modular protein) [uncultured Desulfobacterium sp.]|uniref:histidine kinase n=1 Tax=uncultured Desulfobacterium sp. TaxID=201089 RepID=A0A445N1Y0_9BACT|nr:ATPase/histidine kinase/DNA gyrase B/HSP90 domain protein (modular protein) [uncultured Desulfobacterium sp.]